MLLYKVKKVPGSSRLVLSASEQLEPPDSVPQWPPSPGLLCWNPDTF